MFKRFSITKSKNLCASHTRNVQGRNQKREVDRLLEIKDNNLKYLITFDDTISDNYQGIQTMQITDFLLREDYSS